MPQYKLTQYGLSQYGYFTTATDPETPPGITRKWELQRSRLGARLRSGQLYWVYQHTPIQLKGRTSQLRIKSNTGNTLYLKQLYFQSDSTKIRMRHNLSDQYITTQRLEK